MRGWGVPTVEERPTGPDHRTCIRHAFAGREARRARRSHRCLGPTAGRPLPARHRCLVYRWSAVSAVELPRWAWDRHRCAARARGVASRWSGGVGLRSHGSRGAISVGAKHHLPTRSSDDGSVGQRIGGLDAGSRRAQPDPGTRSGRRPGQARHAEQGASRAATRSILNGHPPSKLDRAEHFETSCQQCRESAQWFERAPAKVFIPKTNAGSLRSIARPSYPPLRSGWGVGNVVIAEVVFIDIEFGSRRRQELDHRHRQMPSQWPRPLLRLLPGRPTRRGLGTVLVMEVPHNLHRRINVAFRAQRDQLGTNGIQPIHQMLNLLVNALIAMPDDPPDMAPREDVFG